MRADPTLAVLAYSGLAMLSAAFGAIPVAFRQRLPPSWLGWANAVAAGLMLGVAYILMAAGLPQAPTLGAAGAVLGIAFLYWTHGVSGTQELDLDRLGDPAPDYGYRLLLVNTMHAVPEGIAMGVAMTLSPSLGAFMALAIAVHNVPEAAVLAAVLRSRGLTLVQATAAATATRLSQVLFAVTTFAVVAAAPALVPWALGVAVGALLYLVMAELLPHCYRQAGHTSVALVAILAMGMVVLLATGTP
ncbi:MAG TPA: ZIP family metal transporter [Gemmatimonadales bacterium]|nr:ZIP family metal transporter [Gemmatimonadales bacterium]